ncbi:MAG: hypothetical protein AB1633_11535 [Elusimicrobiota bacterium]
MLLKKTASEIFAGDITRPIIKTAKIICARLKKNFATFSLRRFVNFINIIPPFNGLVNNNIAEELRRLCEDLKKSLGQGRKPAVIDVFGRPVKCDKNHIDFS